MGRMTVNWKPKPLNGASRCLLTMESMVLGGEINTFLNTARPKLIFDDFIVLMIIIIIMNYKLGGWFRKACRH